MLRQLDKDDVELILDILDDEDVFTFADARRSLGMNATVCKDIMDDLVFFGLVSKNGDLYAVDRANVKLWKRYGREPDYRVLARSDALKTYFNDNGINTDVPTYEGKQSWDDEV